MTRLAAGALMLCPSPCFAWQDKDAISSNFGVDGKAPAWEAVVSACWCQPVAAVCHCWVMSVVGLSMTPTVLEPL